MKIKILIVNIPNYGNIAVTQDLDLSMSDELVYDDNNHNIKLYREYSKLPQNYLSAFIYKIIGGSIREISDLSESAISYPILIELTSFIKLNNLGYSELAYYKNNDIVVLDYVDDRLVFDIELTESRSKLQGILNDSTLVTNDQLVNAIKSTFNLVDDISDEPVTEEVSEVGKTPASIAPSTLSEFSIIAQNYLTNESYVKGDYVEFELNTPYSTFVTEDESGNSLLKKIQDYYKSGGWLEVTAEEITSNSIEVTELIPFVDNNLYIKVGDNYVKSAPKDIKVKLNSGELVDLFDGDVYLIVSPPVIQNGQVISGTESYKLTSNLGFLNSDGTVESLSGHKLVTSDGLEVDSSLYYKLDNSVEEYTPVNGLNSSLYLASTSTVTSSKTRFKFKFK